jgi:hypothetical protein
MSRGFTERDLSLCEIIESEDGSIQVNQHDAALSLEFEGRHLKE